MLVLEVHECALYAAVVCSNWSGDVCGIISELIEAIHGSYYVRWIASKIWSQ
jgi:hypothetical protein